MRGAARKFEELFAELKRGRGAATDAELPASSLRELAERFKSLYEFPQDPQVQLAQAIRAVFDSWSGERAVQYRRINHIPDDGGQPSTSNRWCSATKARARPPVSCSVATRSPERQLLPETS
jgi:hypothetical protein